VAAEAVVLVVHQIQESQPAILVGAIPVKVTLVAVTLE
jgi:hypothetical protein